MFSGMVPFLVLITGEIPGAVVAFEYAFMCMCSKMCGEIVLVEGSGKSFSAVGA